MPFSYNWLLHSWRLCRCDNNWALEQWLKCGIGVWAPHCSSTCFTFLYLVWLYVKNKTHFDADFKHYLLLKCYNQINMQLSSYSVELNELCVAFANTILDITLQNTNPFLTQVIKYQHVVTAPHVPSRHTRYRFLVKFRHQNLVRFRKRPVTSFKQDANSGFLGEKLCVWPSGFTLEVH